jgi:1-acyl-sn-glycerol-3-phosphate acyltransferase
MKNLCKPLFFALFMKPIVKIVLGLNIKNEIKLPAYGPAIIVANHNSHLDTIVLMCLFPLSIVHKVRPVAAADYWNKNKLITWFADTCIGIIPISRKPSSDKDSLLTKIVEALDSDSIVIFFPEGSRGNPEEMNQFKKGICHLAMNANLVPIIPVFLYGLGKALPRGEGLLVPFVCDVNVGDQNYWNGDKDNFLAQIQDSINKLGSETRNFEKETDSVYFG